MENVILDSRNWFELKTLVEEVFYCEGVRLELLSLTEKQKDDIKQNDDYDIAVKEAASLGLATGRNRINEDAEKLGHIDEWWESVAQHVDSDPSVQDQVGERVLAISGLDEFLTALKQLKADEVERLRLEEAASIVIDSDNKTPDPESELDEIEKAHDAAIAAIAV